MRSRLGFDAPSPLLCLKQYVNCRVLKKETSSVLDGICLIRKALWVHAVQSLLKKLGEVCRGISHGWTFPLDSTAVSVHQITSLCNAGDTFSLHCHVLLQLGFRLIRILSVTNQ